MKTQRTWWIVLVATLLLGWGAESAHAQMSRPLSRAPRARTLMQEARKAFSRGNFESAATLYQQAYQMNEQRPQLTAGEHKDLKEQIQRNSGFLKSQRAGREQLRQAEEALTKGLKGDAAGLLRKAGTNPYLSDSDKQTLRHLSLRLQSGRGDPSVVAGPELPMPDTAEVDANDYDALIKQARAAFKAKDYDAAEGWAEQAKKVDPSFIPTWLRPWDDSPARILRDVRNARARADAAQNPTPNAVAKKGGFNPIKSMRNLIYFRSKKTGDEDTEKQPKNDTPSEMPKIVSGKPGADKDSPPRLTKTEEARRLVRQGLIALKNNDMNRARIYAERARSLQPKLAKGEATPEMLLAAINRRTTDAVGQPAKTAAKPAQKFTPIPGKKLSAVELLKVARQHLEAGKIDEAEKYCVRAEIAPDAKWGGLFERDNPRKLRADIKTARSSGSQTKSAKLMALALSHFQKNEMKEAKAFAILAKQLHSPSGVWQNTVNPDQLLARIHAEQAKQGGKALPPLPPPPPGTGQIVKGKSDLPPPPAGQTASATERELAKQKILAQLKEARRLQADKKLIEARVKVMAAKQAAEDARKLGVAFGPNDDNPHWALTQMAGQSLQHINRLMYEADQTVVSSPDPARYQRAADKLLEARQLAAAYLFPLEPLDQKLAYLQKVSGQPLSIDKGKLPGMPGGNVPQLTKDQEKGKQLIKDALSNFRAGHVKVAYEIAIEAHNPQYGVQQHAAEVLNLINSEKFNQKIVNANSAADMVRDHYIQARFRDAWTLAQTIDMKLLTPEKRHRLQEILTMPEIQSVIGGTQTVGGIAANPPGKVKISDGNPPVIEPGSPDVFDRLKAAEEILFSKLRKESLAVQVEARKAVNNGDYDRALEMLREYQRGVGQSELAPERISVLQRDLDRRVQQFKVIIAQQDWEKKRLAVLRDKGISHPAHKHYLKKKHDDEEISNLMEQYRGYYRKAKYKEALLVAKKARSAYPDNPTVNMSYEMANIALNKKEYKSIEEEKSDYFIRELNMRPGQHLDIHSPLSIDEKTMMRARKRGDPGRYGYRLAAKRQKELEIERNLEKTINLNFKDVPLRQTLDDMSYLGGINIVPDSASLKESGVSLDLPLSLKVENVTLKTALDLLLKKVHLTWVNQGEVIEITTENNAQGKQYQVVYPVGDLVIPVVDAPPAHLMTLKDALVDNPLARQNSYFGPRVVTTPYTLPGGAPVSSFSGDSQGSNFGAAGGQQGGLGGATGSWLKGMPRRTIEDQLIRLVQSTVAPDSWSEVGGKGTIQYYPLGYGLVVNQTQDIQEQIADLLDALRKLQDLEVAIEIRLIAVSETFFEYIGVDFDVIFTTDQGRFEPQLTTQQFQPGNFVNRFLPDGFTSGLTPAGTFTPDLNIPLNNSSMNFTVPPIGGFPGALGANGGLALGLAFLSDIQVFMFMEAAQGDRRANTMQAPRVTVFNGQLATLQVADSVPFLTGINPTFFGDQLVFVPQQQPLQFGTAITVQPVVSADRRFVRLAVTQQMQNLVSTNVPIVPVGVPVFQPVPDRFQDGVISTQPKIFELFLQQPSTATIAVQTTVTVPDGGTVLLGGLKFVVETRLESGPPVLSKIPYISRLFRNQSYGREAISLMMMVTPRIIINEEEELIFLEEIDPIPRP